MDMKMPAFQFYPADWRKDPGVQALGFFERGVWFEILCLMHESDERGVLLLNGMPMPEQALSRVLGLDNQILNQTLTTLLTYGVASRREPDGALYSRRMVKDEKLCQIRRESGKQGGNPNLVKQKPKQKPTTGVNQNPTPSSSSSITSSSSKLSNTTTGEKTAVAPEAIIEEIEKLEVKDLEVEKATHTRPAPPAGNMAASTPHLFRDSPLFDRETFDRAFQRAGFENEGIDSNFYYDALLNWSDYGTKNKPGEQFSHNWSKELASFIRRDKNAQKVAMFKPPEESKPKSQIETRIKIAAEVSEKFDAMCDESGNLKPEYKGW